MWAIVAGATAPESSAIATNMQLVGQVNADGDGIVMDEGKPVPVKATSEGIEALSVVFANQYKNTEGDGTYVGWLDKDNFIRSEIETCKATIAAFNEGPTPARIAELEAMKSMKSDEKKELEAAKKEQESINEMVAKVADLENQVLDKKNASENERVLFYAKQQMKINAEKMIAARAEIEAMQVANDDAKKVVAELKDKKNLKSSEKSALKAAEETVAAYDKLTEDLKVYTSNDETWKRNIPEVEKTIAQNKADAESVVALATAVSVNIYWFYGLMVFAIVFVIIAFIIDYVHSLSYNLVRTIIKSVVYVAVVALIFGGAFLVAASNDWMNGQVLFDVKGNPLGVGSDSNRYVFGAFEYMTAEISILVTYVAFVGAALAAIFSEARGIFKS